MPHEVWFVFFWAFVFGLSFLETRFSASDSAPNRAARWPVNIGLGVINGLIISLVPIGTVLAAGWATSAEIGLLNWIAAPYWVAFVVTILVRSFGQYAFHWLAHRIPALWSVHRVHHCDTHLDGSTGLRFHPLEMLATLALLTPLAILIGFDPVALALYETVEILIGIATHTSMKLSDRIERRLRIVFITPGLHRLHHSSYVAETDTNFGTVFSFWDRMFKTYRGDSARNASRFTLGLRGVSPKDAANFGAMLVFPLRNVLRNLRGKP